jgi:ketosteroid isomerase-like protein
MSQENVEIVRRWYDAFNRGDIDAVIALLAPGFEFDTTRSLFLNRGIFGPDLVRTWMAEWREHWASSRYEADEYIEAGEHVVTPFTNRLLGRDGIELQAVGVFVWTIRDQAVARLCLYQERDEALEAVGLSE